MESETPENAAKRIIERAIRDGKLPKPVRIEDTITSQETNPPRDPEGGRDTDRDFLLRYGMGG